MHIGYARVSTDDQDLRLQRTALKEAGCRRLYEEKVSGARRDRPQLARLLDQVREHGPRLGAMRSEEAFNQAGLADSGLAGHQRDTTLAGSCLAQRVGKIAQRRLTLEQLHGAASASVAIHGVLSLVKYF